MLAFVFPGQGSQSVGMLADLADRDPIVRATFDEASSGCGLDLWRLVCDGPAEELNRTETTQPAMLAADVAVFRLWRAEGGPEPTLLAGHSLGEYAALVVADALPLADAAGLVRERGRLMQAAVPEGAGAMAAVLGTEDLDLIAACCAEAAQDEVVVPANLNGPGQTVIAGHAAAVDRALALLAGRGVKKSVRLPVSVPSHSPLMRDAAAALAARMDAIAWRAPSIPVVQNADATSHAEPAAIREALARQLHSPVRWTECMQELVRRGASRVGECGPGKALTGMARRIDRSLDARALGTASDFDAALAAWRQA
jgi:[acyl-carrier-protein] S-malonyltransferase